METGTEHKNDKMKLLTQSNKRNSCWIVEQLGLLAVRMGEAVTAERLALYVDDLTDLSQVQIERALWRARRELNFFPKIAELRELAGAKAEDQAHVEAAAAWEFLNRYLQKFGVVIYDDDNRPPLDPRIDCALRRIGGLNALNQITEKSRPFMFNDFCEAYRLAPLADLLTPQLTELFGYQKLVAPKREQLAGKVFSDPEPRLPQKPIVKTIPEPLTDAQLRDRREMIKQQTATIVTKRKHL